ncbi:zinc finger protein neuro-d4-like, partial [Pyxicephalus adspersus]|uniref:zinc finger protein neuro-d4-like n=1 Tax=Pyxicephalus adspersus TaxID=30357 RepID=UPI003B5B98BF
YEVPMPMKKESSLPEGPVLEALLCAETVDKKLELKEEEIVSDCQKTQVGDIPHELDGDDLEDDTPKRKNRAKGKACGIGGLKKRQDPSTLEDRDKPYVCDNYEVPMPMKKESSLPEGPVLEALLCAETVDKKLELKEEEIVSDCQ